MGLNAIDLTHCFGKITKFCHIRQPLVYFREHPSCESALFHNDIHNIQKLCTKTPFHMFAPVALKIDQYVWVISSNFKWIGHTVCFQKSTHNTLLHFDIGLLLFTLESTCTLYSTFFVLPATFSHTMTIVEHKQIIAINFTDFALENANITTSLQYVSIPQSQPETQTWPTYNFDRIHHETRELMDTNNILTNDLENHKSLTFGAIGSTSIFCFVTIFIIILFVIFKFKWLKNKFFRKPLFSDIFDITFHKENDSLQSAPEVQTFSL